MLTLTLAISCLSTSSFLIHGPNIPGSYAVLLFTTSDFTSVISHIHSWVFFCFGSTSSFFLELVLHWSPVAYWPHTDLQAPTNLGRSFFQCPIFLPFHTVHWVLKERILKWFAIPFSRDHILSALSTMTRLSWVTVHSMAHCFIE